jgi:hypothetical protein
LDYHFHQAGVILQLLSEQLESTAKVASYCSSLHLRFEASWKQVVDLCPLAFLLLLLLLHRHPSFTFLISQAYMDLQFC